jgi:uncharacterized protein HemX
MVAILIVVILLLALIVGAVFLLGFRLGGEHGQSELTQVRLQSMQAERRLHDLTRSAFESMAEAFDQRRKDH